MCYCYLHIQRGEMASKKVSPQSEFNDHITGSKYTNTRM